MGRCTAVVAAAGYGKTTAVRRWIAGGHPVDWHSRVDSAVRASERTAAPRWIIVDGPARAGSAAAGSVTLAERAVSRPDIVGVIMTARWPARPAGHHSSGGPSSAGRVPTGRPLPVGVSHIGPVDLALSEAQVADLLREDFGVTDRRVAGRIRTLTGGWPALVVASAAQHIGRARFTDLAGYLVREVLDPLPPAARRFLREAAVTGSVGEEPGESIGDDDLEPTLTWLAATGILLADPAPAVDASAATRWRVVPLVAQVIRRHWPLPVAERVALGTRAGDRHAGNGRPAEALAAYRTAGRLDRAVDLVAAQGPTWVCAGGAADIVDFVGALPPGSRTPQVRLPYGEALMIVGAGEAAVTELTALADEAADPQALPAELAWRLGAAHHLLGDPKAALAALARTAPDPGPTALPLAWRAYAHWMLGDPVAAELADQAVAAAADAGPREQAAGQVAVALSAMLAGDRSANAAAYETALRLATACGDLVQAARITVNRSSLLIEEARYADALLESDRARELASAAAAKPILATALCNQADALTRLARLDEAESCYEEALALFGEQRSHRRAYPLIGLGEVQRWRGCLSLARSAYEEAVRTAERVADQQAMIPALAGLARVLAEHDPGQAVTVATRAVGHACGPYRTTAVLAAGWAALAGGDQDRADRAAAEAAEGARLHRQRAGLAEALELTAAVAATRDAPRARRILSEAAQTWRATGATLDIDRIEYQLGVGAGGADSAARITSLLARERLITAGVAVREPPAGPVVSIRTLGRFEVAVEGAPVPASAWRSRKARDLLRILVSRRGRPIAREQLADLLWPEEAGERVAHRLSVALHTVRAVLDPGRRVPADHYLVAEPNSLVLDTAHLELDLEYFIAEATHGLRQFDRGDLTAALAALKSAERRYAGDFLEDEPYAEWTQSTRESARATYLRIVRILATLHRQTGQIDEAVGYLIKAIDRDPYDERGHQGLIEALTAAGRHGEAQRARRRHADAMRHLGQE